MIWLTILITIVVFAVAIAGMAIGVIVSNRCIRGSCGGLANLRDDQGNPLCEGCSSPSPDCLGNPVPEFSPGNSDQTESGGKSLSRPR